MGDPVRLEALFSGWVQGVGFRYTTEALARDRRVTGFVRNLPDGRVELVCEGDREEVERLLEAIQHRMDRYIRDVESSWGEARGEFRDFGIRF